MPQVEWRMPEFFLVGLGLFLIGHLLNIHALVSPAVKAHHVNTAQDHTGSKFPESPIAAFTRSKTRGATPDSPIASSHTSTNTAEHEPKVHVAKAPLAPLLGAAHAALAAFGIWFVIDVMTLCDANHVYYVYSHNDRSA